MCGLFGWALPEAKARDRGLLIDLTDRLAHRGPDGSGVWLGHTADHGFQLAFGHRRLSIIDLAGGTQPMWSADGATVVVLNGEIYNYIELREELRRLGHSFATQSDTEVLLEAWRAWGMAALPRLRGMFAFALWDSTAQQLVLARDPFGKKPLFLAECPFGLLFSSEIDPLLGFPGVSRGLEPEALRQYLLNRYVPAPLTFFRAVKKLLPGCALVWKQGKYRVERYFTPPLADVAPDFTDFETAVEAFESVFDESVRIRMRSDAPYGAFLSGGIDSSAVVAQMAIHSAQVRTFSVGFREQSWSELHHARAIATCFGTDHRELVVEPDSFLAHWPEAILRRGAPVSEASDIPILMLSHLARQSVKMVLTGEGSDEILGGYPKHQAESWAATYHALMPRVVHKMIAERGAMASGQSRLRILASALGERDFITRMRTWFGGISKFDRAALSGETAAVAPPNIFPFSINTRSALRRILFFDQTSWLPDNLLERGDRMMMAASIEGRMPFMDVELARLAARMPDRFLAGGRGGKRVLRAAMRKVLPPEILTRRKIGFRVPLADWFRDRCRDELRDMLASSHSSVARLCDPSALQRMLEEHLDGRRNNERVLWTLANLELFLRTFRPDGIAEAADTTARRAA
ncbi:MAG TPA: asparagine synthase (glutamine-hydrolyzing) [Rhizomicrobium sp.]|jgi:asparagine synthase (glutamine-hydrolysing)|nr:asparagine synthase (glutamine-hydrolyzing) [Rhizomicrobium sp.]